MDTVQTIEENSISLFRALEGNVEIDVKTEILRQLVELQSPEVTRTLIDHWVDWIAQEDSLPLVELTARLLRTEPHAVLPLVDHFAYPLELTDKLKKRIIKDAVEPAYIPLISVFKPELVDLDLHPQAKNGQNNQDRSKETLESLDFPGYRKKVLGLLDSLANRLPEAERSPEYHELKSQFELSRLEIQTVLERSLALLFEEERLRREKLVYRRVSSQLAHMSDRRFYESVPQKYKLVHNLLEKHAVPVIAFNLPKHTDLETRWRIGLMLGYVGGRVAVDELVTALIDEKSTRDARQKMLYEYYLEPAKRQSQQAADILTKAIQDGRTTMLTLRILNILVFMVGVGLIITAVDLATQPGVNSGGSWTQYSGFFTFIGGLGTILSQLFYKPLDRIQNSVANLVQLETAFTNFIWEINLNGAYIQSRYVADGKLTDYEISQTILRMQKSMTMTMKLIGKHAEAIDEKNPPHLHSIKPATGKSGVSVEIQGQNLQRDQPAKKGQAGMLAINHIPSEVDGLKWEANRVRFNIPNLKESGPIWISLIVGGIESNALPFFVEG